MTASKHSHADEIFRQLLRDLRRDSGFTQMQLALRIGQPQSFVSKFESGERRLDFIETAQVCDALGVSIVDFSTEFLRRLQ